MEKENKGLLYDILGLETPHNHLCIYGIAASHPVYEGGRMITSKVEHIVFQEDGYAEVETQNSFYGIVGEDNARLHIIVESHKFANLTVDYLDD